MNKSGKWIIYLIIAVIVVAVVWLFAAKGGCPFGKCEKQCAPPADDNTKIVVPVTPIAEDKADAETVPGNVAAEEVQADLQSVEVNP